jgi:hypothetical protein
LRSPGLRILVLALCASLLIPLVGHRPARAQRAPIRLSVNKWKVEPGDNYTLSWMESGSVQPISDYIVEEDSDPQFKDKDNYNRYVVRAHRKALENTTSFSHTVRYYRVRTRAWVRNYDDQQVQDEVVSNTVRVTLLGTDKSPPPSFPDDPEEPVKKPKKDPKDKKPEDAYPTMGRPDFVIQRIFLDPSSPKVGETFKVHVTVRNTGVVPAPIAQVKIEVAGRQYVSEVEAMKPGYAVDAVSPPITVHTAGPLPVTATVDPFQRVAESREDNNTRTMSLSIAEAAPRPAPSASPAASPSGKPNGSQ